MTIDSMKDRPSDDGREMRARFPKIRRAAKTVLFALAPVSMMLLLLASWGELHFRRVAWQEKPWAPREQEVRIISADQPVVKSHLPGLSYVWRPNVDAGEEQRTNSWGYHDDEFVVPKPKKGTIRIALLGDSMTYGYDVSPAATYANRLERMLNEHAGEKKFDVVNLGVPGYQTLQSYATLKYIALPLLDPDMVVYAFFCNDLEDGDLNFYRFQTKFPAICPVGEVLPGRPGADRSAWGGIELFLRSRSALYAELQFRWEILKYEGIFPAVQRISSSPGKGLFAQAVRAAAAFAPSLQPHLSSCARYELSSRLMREIATLAEGRGARFLVLHIPLLDRLDCADCDYGYRDFMAFFSAGNPDVPICWAHGYLRRSLKERGIQARALCLNERDSHPGTLGHELLAEALYEYLTVYDLLPRLASAPPRE